MSEDRNPNNLDNLLDAIEGAAPEFEMEFLREIVHAGEDVIALEVLCDNLYESGTRLQPPLFARLVAACTANGVDERHCSNLEAARSLT